MDHSFEEVDRSPADDKDFEDLEEPPARNQTHVPSRNNVTPKPEPFIALGAPPPPIRRKLIKDVKAQPDLPEPVIAAAAPAKPRKVVESAFNLRKKSMKK
jgi:hypothetical protein